MFFTSWKALYAQLASQLPMITNKEPYTNFLVKDNTAIVCQPLHDIDGLQHHQNG